MELCSGSTVIPIITKGLVMALSPLEPGGVQSFCCFFYPIFAFLLTHSHPASPIQIYVLFCNGWKIDPVFTENQKEGFPFCEKPSLSKCSVCLLHPFFFICDKVEHADKHNCACRIPEENGNDIFQK